MTNEEMERAMRFILKQQAQFAANQQRHDEAMQRHEEVMQRHGEAMREHDETIRRIESTQEVTAQQITHLGAAMAELAEAQARAEAVAAGTKDRIDILIDSQIKNEERFAANEQRLAALTEANEKRFAALADAQARGDERLDRLAATVERFINERRNGNP